MSSSTESSSPSSSQSQSPLLTNTPINQPVTTAEHSADISGFFTGGSVRVVSDPEGYHVAQLANENREGAPANKILVLGDLFDYTLGAGDNFNNFATTKLTELRNAKSHSFESVKYCIENPGKIKVLFGNRDLNKLKLLPLVLVTNSEGENIGKYVKWWEADNYELGAQTLKDSIANNTYKWDIPSMANWKPFWKADYNTCKHWDTNSPRLVTAETEKQMSCLERFYLIFGRDCLEGTISAQNTLFGVANECGLYEKIFGRYQTELNNMIKDKNSIGNHCILNTATPELKYAAEQAAALVFTVFADSLYGEGNPTEGKPFTGVLREFFRSENTYYCAYAELGGKEGNDLLTFSHGGLREEFFKCGMEQGLVSQISKSTKLSNMVQQGGYIGTNAQVLAPDEITGRINDYNSQMKSGLIKLIGDYRRLIGDISKNGDKPTAELLLNLVISAPYAAPEGGSSCLHKDSSPINPGLPGYRLKPICVSGKTLYQFVGHLPLGFAPTIDKYTSGSDGLVSYAINLDVSNSLFGQLDKLAPGSIAQNYSYVEVVSDGELKLLSNINVEMAENAIIPRSADKNIIILNYNLLSNGLFDELEPNGSDSDTLTKFKTFIMASTVKNNKPHTWNKEDWEKIKKLPVNIHGRTQKNSIIATIVAPNFDVYVYNLNTKPEEFTKFKGGKSSMRRMRQPKSKRTSKCRTGATKMHVRTTRTLVKRCHPRNRKHTARK